MPPNALRVTLAFAVLVTVAACQLFFQQLSMAGAREAEADGFLQIYLGNLIASLPWLPMAFGILWLTERLPPTSKRRFGAHGAVSVLVALSFLAWLASFHTWITESPREQLWSSYRFWFRQGVGDFFSLALLIYWLVVAAGLAMASRARLLAEQQQRQALEAKIETQPEPTGVEPLVIRSHGRSQLVQPETVVWIGADAGYARLYTEDGSFLLRRSLSELAEEFAPLGFARIHRSTIVRLDQIVELRSLSHGEALAVLRGGQELKVSRTYRDSLARLGL